MKERPILFSAPMVRAILDGRKTQTRRIMKPQPEATPSDYPGKVGHWWPCDAVQSMVHVEQELRNDSGQWGGFAASICPYGGKSDRLWVRETWQFYDWTEDGEPCIRFGADNATTWPVAPRGEALVDQWEILSRHENYSIDNAARDRRWRPSIHMPRWASRILLEIVSVRVERLQDISEADAIAEGIQKWGEPHPRRGQRWDCPPHAQRFGEGDNVEDAGFAGGAVKDPREAYRGLWASINGPGSWESNPWVWVVEFKRVEG